MNSVDPDEWFMRYMQKTIGAFLRITDLKKILNLMQLTLDYPFLVRVHFSQHEKYRCVLG